MDCLALHRLLLHPLGTAGVPEPLGEGVVVDLQLRHFLVLICCDCDELALLEHVGPEGGVGELEDVAGPDQVEPRLVLVHRVQDRLRIKVKGRILSSSSSVHIRLAKKSRKMLSCYIGSRIALERQRQTS